MLKAFAHELASHLSIAQDSCIVVGVSGGPDSIALLHLLYSLNQQSNWRLKLHIAHLNHQLRREEADADAAFVQGVADDYSLPCTIDARDIASLSSPTSAGEEEVGRHERYAFFERVCLKAGARMVAVGHHADDNAETILHRILRGTGLRGLAGIPADRPLHYGSEINLIRPLLRFTRKAICEYLDDVGVAYREDKSNNSNEPMRNRIRNLILPQVEAQVNPQVRDALTRLGEQAQWLEEYLSETVQRTFETLVIARTDQELILNGDAVGRKSRIVQTELVRLAYRSFGLGEQNLSFANLVAAVDLIGDSSSGKHVQLPGGMEIEKRYKQLVFSFPSDEPREAISPEIAVHVPGKTTLPIRRLAIDCTIEDVEEADIRDLRDKASPMEEYVDFDAVRLPLVVRPRRSGERFFPLGAPGTKKLSDFLTDAKVKPLAREKVAVLCDHLGPIWIIGHRIDDRVKITSLTRRVLHLQARPIEST